MEKDYHDIHQTAKAVTAMGVRKSRQRIDQTFLKSFLGGIFLSFGGLFLVIVGGGSMALADTLGSGIHRMIRAAVFPIGIILIILTGVDLFTSNTMILSFSTLTRKTTFKHLVVSWAISFLGNAIGCLFFQCIFVYYAGVLAHESSRAFVVELAEKKGSSRWYEIFLRGIVGNWLACLGLWLGAGAPQLISKVVAIYLPVWFFVAVGYEHSIANMFTVQMGMILGANLSLQRYLSHVLLPVVLGNILGGGFFVGFIFWYLSYQKTETTGVNCRSTTDDHDALCESQQP